VVERYAVRADTDLAPETGETQDTAMVGRTHGHTVMNVTLS
jgi:hypothetical protein